MDELSHPVTLQVALPSRTSSSFPNPPVLSDSLSPPSLCHCNLDFLPAYSLASFLSCPFNSLTESFVSLCSFILVQVTYILLYSLRVGSASPANDSDFHSSSPSLTPTSCRCQAHFRFTHRLKGAFYYPVLSASRTLLITLWDFTVNCHVVRPRPRHQLPESQR